MKLENQTIGYIPKGFPRLSETFVSNEILELERLGVQIQVFSIMNPKEKGMQPSARAVRAPRHYVPERVLFSLHRVLPAHLALAFKRPDRYWSTFFRAIRRAFQRRSTSSLRRFAQAGFLVERFVGKQEIRHFHAHFCHGPTTVALFVKWLTGATFSFTAHAKDLYTTAPESLRDKMRQAEFVLTCTQANQAYLERLGGDVVPVHCIYHGIDIERFTPPDASRTAPEAEAADPIDVPLVLSVGRLVEKKGHDVLIRACALLRDRGTRFRCVIHGEGPMRIELEALRSSLGLDDVVQLPGRILQDDLVNRYAKADLFALACQVLENGDRDGLPNVIIEALAMELPVVSTNISGVPELIENGVSGLLVQPRAPQELADAIETLLADVELRRRLARAGRRRVLDEFDTRRNTRLVLELFENVNGLVAVNSSPASEVPSSAAASPI